jgi:hypothetical protein
MKIASKYDVPKNENHKLYDEIRAVDTTLKVGRGDIQSFFGY